LQADPALQLRPLLLLLLLLLLWPRLLLLLLLLLWVLPPTGHSRRLDGQSSGGVNVQCMH
jgi:hypothetical protein